MGAYIISTETVKNKINSSFPIVIADHNNGRINKRLEFCIDTMGLKLTVYLYSYNVFEKAYYTFDNTKDAVHWYNIMKTEDDYDTFVDFIDG